MMEADCLYDMTVTHVRHRPVRHALRYRIFMTLLDLDRLSATARQCRLFSVGRFNLLGLNPADHGTGPGIDTPAALKRWVQGLATAEGIDLAGGRVILCCMPRVLGYAFNPISLYFCTDAANTLRVVAYEVHNTFGQRHVYLADVARDDMRPGPMRHHAPKRFHVSPFMPMEMGYRFTLARPGRRFALSIRGEAADDGTPLIDAVMTGERRPLSDAQILRAVARMPLLGIKVVAAIHWEALKLWRKKLRFHRAPPPPSNVVTMGS